MFLLANRLGGSLAQLVEVSAFWVKDPGSNPVRVFFVFFKFVLGFADLEIPWRVIIFIVQSLIQIDDVEQ
jgi:hypothetical protein